MKEDQDKMLRRIEHEEEAIESISEVRRYAEAQRRGKFMYRPLVKELQALQCFQQLHIFYSFFKQLPAQGYAKL